MKLRGSIPVEHWQRLVAAAQARGIEGVTFETLTLAHSIRVPAPERVGGAKA